MMPTDNTNTTQAALSVPGIEPELLEIGLLFADLTPQERTQAWAFLDSLLQQRGA